MTKRRAFTPEFKTIVVFDAVSTRCTCTSAFTRRWAISRPEFEQQWYAQQMTSQMFINESQFSVQFWEYYRN